MFIDRSFIINFIDYHFLLRKKKKIYFYYKTNNNNFLPIFL